MEYEEAIENMLKVILKYSETLDIEEWETRKSYFFDETGFTFEFLMDILKKGAVKDITLEYQTDMIKGAFGC